MTNKGAIVYWKNTSLYLNITNRCSNDCLFCVRNYRQGVYGFNLKLEKEPIEKELMDAIKQELSRDFVELVFTGYGEPLLRLDLVCNIAKQIKQLTNDKLKLRIDTNGLADLAYPEINVLEKLREAKIDKLSISLNTENAEKYLKICQPIYGSDSYESLLNFAEKAKRHFEVRFTVVAIPQVDIDACQQIADEMAIPLIIRPYNGPDFTID
ncbi:MAG: TatD family nuclease-associated radical SAM protein [Candidatus Heimdallarchaeota archaeon]